MERFEGRGGPVHGQWKRAKCRYPTRKWEWKCRGTRKATPLTLPLCSPQEKELRQDSQVAADPCFCLYQEQPRARQLYSS